MWQTAAEACQNRFIWYVRCLSGGELLKRTANGIAQWVVRSNRGIKSGLFLQFHGGIVRKCIAHVQIIEQFRSPWRSAQA